MSLLAIAFTGFVLYVVLITRAGWQPGTPVAAGLLFVLASAIDFTIGETEEAFYLGMGALFFIASGLAAMFIRGVTPSLDDGNPFLESAPHEQNPC